MDAKGMVLEAVRTLGWATRKEIVRFLDERGEELSKLELERALEALIAEGRLEAKDDLFRLAKKRGARAAFDALFNDEGPPEGGP